MAVEKGNQTAHIGIFCVQTLRISYILMIFENRNTGTWRKRERERERNGERAREKGRERESVSKNGIRNGINLLLHTLNGLAEWD